MNLIRKTWAFLTSRNGFVVIVILLVLLFLEIFRIIGWSPIEQIIRLLWNWMFNNIIAIIGILFAFVGWNQSSQAGKTLNQIQGATEYLNKDIEKIQATEQDMQKALKEVREAEERLERSIFNLEDATRRNLKGFAEIFARALWLLEKSEEEIWYVNFLFGFGYPHLYNNKIHKDYTPLAKVLGIKELTFEDGVPRFFEAFIEKIQKIPRFYAIVLTKSSLDKLFLERLKNRTDYVQIADRIEAEVDREQRLYKRINGAINARNENIKKDFHVYQQERLPFQLLITQIRKGKEHNERKWGCLVFLVGTENIETGSQNKEPKGFYTELDHVVDVYREIASSLKESATAFDWEKWKEEMNRTNINSVNSVNQKIDTSVN